MCACVRARTHAAVSMYMKILSVEECLNSFCYYLALFFFIMRNERGKVYKELFRSLPSSSEIVNVLVDTNFHLKSLYMLSNIV